jgi:galactose mutarotase-like enzyme
MGIIENQAFRAFVQQRMTAPEVSSETVKLSDGDNFIDIRLAGGYITKCVLGAPAMSPASILYSDENLSRPKIDASHTMSPVGPELAALPLGGQHGAYRWADYEVTARSPTNLVLAAKTSTEYPDLIKMFRFDSGDKTTMLIMKTILTNNTSKRINTSLGDHLYWPLANKRLDGLSLSSCANQAVDVLSDSRKLALIASGKSHAYLPADTNEYDIRFPDGLGIRLYSEAQIISSINSTMKKVASARVGLLLWRRTNTESICFEPVVGMQGSAEQLIPVDQVGNQGVRLNKGASVVLTTAVSLLPPA